MRINSFVTPESLSENILALSSDESHHLARVLRVQPGQELTLFDGQGTRASGIVDSVTKKEVTVRVAERETVPPPKVEITLIQAVCKPDRFELILQKATELGVRNIVPVLTANASLPQGKIDKMIGRGEAILRNAAQQCGTAWLPVFQPLEKIDAIFPDIGNCRAGTAEGLPAAAGRSSTVPALQKFDVCFIGSLHPNAVPFKKAFEQLRCIQHTDQRASPVAATDGRGSAVTDRAYSNGSDAPPALKAALMIGPEGDFTEEEVHAAVAAGAIPVTFGKQILRTETAAMFGLSVLAYELF